MAELKDIGARVRGDERRRLEQLDQDMTQITGIRREQQERDRERLREKPRHCQNLCLVLLVIALLALAVAVAFVVGALAVIETFYTIVWQKPLQQTI